MYGTSFYHSPSIVINNSRPHSFHFFFQFTIKDFYLQSKNLLASHKTAALQGHPKFPAYSQIFLSRSVLAVLEQSRSSRIRRLHQDEILALLWGSRGDLVENRESKTCREVAGNVIRDREDSSWVAHLALVGDELVACQRRASLHSRRNIKHCCWAIPIRWQMPKI